MAKEKTQEIVQVVTSVVHAGTIALYPINKAYIVGQSAPIMALMDAGSNAPYVKESCAQRLGRVDNVTLDVTTMGGEQKEYDSMVYEVPMRISNSRVWKLLVYALKEITGPLSAMVVEVLYQRFPEIRPQSSHQAIQDSQSSDRDWLFPLTPEDGSSSHGREPQHHGGVLGACLVGTHL